MTNVADQSAVYWGELPQGWDLVPLKHGFKLIGSGTTPATNQLEYFDGSVAWVNTAELRENVITKTEKTVTEFALQQYSALRVYPPGTVLVAMYGATIGRVGILNISACVNQAVCALADPVTFDSRFVAYALQSSRDYLLSLASGGGQPNLSLEKVINHEIPTPSLSQQRAIADYLDDKTAEIDELLIAKQELLTLLAEKRSALITHAVTRGLAADVPLRDSGVEWLGQVPAHWEIEYARWLFREVDDRSETGDEELLTVSHLTGVTRRSEKDVNMFMAESLEGYKRCEAGDLVINTLWAWMGAMGVAIEPGIVSPAYNVYRPNHYLPDYLDFLVRIPAFATEVTRYSKGVWSSRLRLYPSEFFQVLMPVPTLEEQRAIADFLNQEVLKLDRLHEAAEKTIEILQERRTALIAAAVTGQIDVVTKSDWSLT